jgi:tRNA nucleotidyltransferase (CCA-adding enzyme)
MRVSAIGHEDAGIETARVQLRRLTNHNGIASYVTNMVGMHMRPNSLANAGSHVKKTRAMFDKSVNSGDLILLSSADVSVTSQAREADSLRAFLFDRLDDYRKRMREPMLTGRDLIDAGFAPGPDFTWMLERAKLFHFAGLSPENALKQLRREARTRMEKAGESSTV